MFRWKNGRQGTGYKVLTLFKSKLLKCDVYIIKYDVGAFIPKHLDPAPDGYVHKRTNICWRSVDCLGGEAISYDVNLERFLGFVWFNRFGMYTFHPSETEHEVTTIRSGRRYVLSFGRLVKKSTYRPYSY